MRIIIGLFLCLVAGALFAKSGFPVGCKAIVMRGQTVNLKTKHAKTMFIHNISSSDLWLTHPVTGEGANAGWTSRIQAGNWSALAVDKPSFILGCIESKPGHEQEVPCEGAIQACQWRQANPPKGEKGTFWAAEDQPLAVLTAALESRGFVLKE